MKEINTDWIKTVKEQENGWLVNNSMFVPNDEGNRHYKDIKEWLKDNTPEPEFTDEEILRQKQKAIDNAIQETLDKKAQEFRWDDMKSARAGAMSIKDTDSDIVRNMKENAQKLTDWYYEVWAYASQLEADVKSGNREIPTVNEVLEEMPKYEE